MRSLRPMELFSHIWACWVLFAIICAILEVTVPSFTFSFASVAALAAAVISLKFGWIYQAIGFAGFLVLSIAALRPRLRKMLLQRKHHMPSRAEALTGL